VDHSATVRRFYDLINAGDIDGFGALLAPDFIEHEELPGLEATREGVMRFFRMYGEAFPDLHMEVKDVIATGERVVVRAQVTGTQTGPLLGMPATGKGVDVQIIDIMGMGADGLCHEHWGVMDQLRMMQQLGVVPADPPT
jgi:steroid delta-isomerase-like uncharacterized protein